MRWHSLRLRLIAGGLAAILIALMIAGIALTFLFERHVARTLSDDLDVHLKQLLAGLDVDPQNGLVVTKPPVDPRFSDPCPDSIGRSATTAASSCDRAHCGTAR